MFPSRFGNFLPKSELNENRGIGFILLQGAGRSSDIEQFLERREGEGRKKERRRGGGGGRGEGKKKREEDRKKRKRRRKLKRL